MSDIAPTKTIWFRIGYALERARQTASTGVDPIPATPRLVQKGREAPEHRSDALGEEATPAVSTATATDPFADAAASWVERQLVSRLLRAKNPGYLALGRAALAGAGAELAAVVVRAALLGPPASDRQGGPDGLGSLLQGAAEGMVFASLVRPFVPGPTWARGAAFGVARYFAVRGGGLPKVLGSLSPHRQIPGLDSLVTPRTGDRDTWAEHVVAGVVLAVLYESSDLSSGTNPDRSDGGISDGRESRR